MKKTYFAPVSEEIVLNVMTPILAGSSAEDTISGGGINSDGSANTSDDDNTDPGLFGW